MGDEKAPGATDPTLRASTLTVRHDDLPAAPAWHAQDRARYELGDEIARGGGGRVVTARDKRLGRDVAVKLPLDAAGARRLVREALLVAQLEHPSIVSVHDLGLDDDGSPFYVMKLLDGDTLRARIADASFEDRIALLPTLIAICDALAYAHHRGYVHRDVKPSNVIVGRFGEAAVIDWGLARATDDDSVELHGSGPLGVDLTSTGAVVGTPAYMPPEQARGEAVDARADVYGLGALAYHVLAGVPPYDGAAPGHAIARVLEGPPAPLRDREGRIPADLAAIVGKAMAREASERYATAEELAGDLRRYQAGRLVAAHRYTLRQRATRWVRRHRAPVFGATLAVGAAIAAVVAWPERGDDAAAMCSRAGEDVAGVWSWPQREAVVERMGDSATSPVRLDAYAMRLRAARIDACAATNVRGEQSADVLDRRMECLDRRREGLAAVIGLAPELDRAHFARAVDALGDIESCGDRERLRSTPPMPANPALRAQVATLYAQLATATALADAGQFHDALEAARRVIATPTGHAPLDTEAHLAIGTCLQELGKLKQAEPEFRRAYLDAERSHDDWMRTDALYRLARSAIELGANDEAKILLGELDALVARLGDLKRRVRRLDLEAGFVERLGDLTRAIDLNRQAVAIAERVGDRSLLATALGNLAVRLETATRWAEAEPIQRRALALFAEVHGVAHPNYGRGLAGLGTVLVSTHHPAEALPLYRKAVEILNRAGIDNTEEILTLRNNIAATLSELGRTDDAEREMIALVSVEENLLGPGAIPIGSLLWNLGNNRLGAGQAAAAEPWFRKAVEQTSRYRGPDHVRTAHARWGLAATLLELGRPREALPELERALPVQLKQDGPDSDDLPWTQRDLARAYVAVGQPAKALEPARACQAYFDKYFEAGDRGRARITLGYALDATGDRAHALELAAKARADFVEAKTDASVAEVDRFTASRRVPGP